MIRLMALVALVVSFQSVIAENPPLPYTAQVGDRVLKPGDDGFKGWSGLSVLTNFLCNEKDGMIVASRDGKLTLGIWDDSKKDYSKQAFQVSQVIDPNDKNLASHNPFEYNTFFKSIAGQSSDGSQVTAESFLGMRLHSDIVLVWTRPAANAPWSLWAKCVER